MTTKFSANLGFLWTELPLPEAIGRAAAHGFDAVECHFPYETPSTEVVSALNSTGLQMLGLNTVKGNVAEGDNGLSALPDRIDEARASIDQAIEYAVATKTQNVHVMAGNTDNDKATVTFVDNLGYACEKAASSNINILIEPLNPFDAPGYYLRDTKHAQQIIETVAAKNLKLMFDCYHVQVVEGDICRKLKSLLPIIGHIQFAAAPNRTAPDDGELDFGYVFKAIADLGYTAPLGAEYKPSGPTEESLGWMQKLR